MIIAVNLLEAAGLALLLTSLLRCYALHRRPSQCACRRFLLARPRPLDKMGASLPATFVVPTLLLPQKKVA